MQPGVVAYPSQPAIALRDDAGWRDAELWQMSHVGRGNDHPLTLVDHVPKLRMQELQVIHAQSMFSPSKIAVDLVP